MMRSQAESETSATAALWSGRWIVLGTVCAFAGAAFLMSALLPERHVARIRFTADTPMVASARPLPVDASLPGAAPSSRIDRVVADARAALEGRSVGAPSGGLDRAADGAVVIWAEAATSAEARVAAATIADRFESATPTGAAPAVPGTAPGELEALRREAAAARELSTERAAEAERLPDAGPGAVAELEAALRDSEARRDALRRDIGTWRESAEALRAGDGVPDTLSSLPGWSELRRLKEERVRLDERVEEMRRTLLDGHPRMVIARLRLDDLRGELRPVEARVLADAERELRRRQGEAEAMAGEVAARREALEAARAAAAELGEARTAARVADEVADRLEAALAEEGREASATREVPAPLPARVAWTRSEPSVETIRMNPWPSAAAGAGVGFIASTLGLLGVGLVDARRRRSPAELAAEAPGTVACDAPSSREIERGEPVPGAELAAVDDVIEAIVSSGVARTMVVSAGPAGNRPLSVDIVRRLALRGRSAVLVDLSAGQRAARAMGAYADHPGLRDLIDGRATFASIARHDFATQADIVPYGSEPADQRLDTPQERRNVLEFIERSYDVLLVDCGDMPATDLRPLMDSDAALLVAVGQMPPDEAAAAIDRLHAAGLDDLIVVREPLAS